MKCAGCGDHRVVVKSRVPLCRHCAQNARGGGEFGDWDDELALESLSLDLLEPGSGAPGCWLVEELWGTPQGTYI